MAEPIPISIVVPAYNESTRIGQSLQKILFYLTEQGFAGELIVVDDGSTDETGQVVQNFIRCNLQSPLVQLVLLSNSKNMGKGYSIRAGVLRATKAIVVFTDADLSTPITEFPKLVDPIRKGAYDVVIGSRALNRELIGQHQPLWRESAGRIFNLLMRLIVGLKFKDTQCGFKAYRRSLIWPVFQGLKLHGYSFDVEVLFLAKKRGVRIAEVPVVWNHAEGSRVHLFKDSLKMLVELLQIRWYALTGKYAGVIDATAAEET
jgi:glycosyltransferase involved in cell wall biosynthesis